LDNLWFALNNYLAYPQRSQFVVSIDPVAPQNSYWGELQEVPLGSVVSFTGWMGIRQYGMEDSWVIAMINPVQIQKLEDRWVYFFDGYYCDCVPLFGASWQEGAYHRLSVITTVIETHFNCKSDISPALPTSSAAATCEKKAVRFADESDLPKLIAPIKRQVEKKGPSEAPTLTAILPAKLVSAPVPCTKEIHYNTTDSSGWTKAVSKKNKRNRRKMKN
jgi:hypothetical protein